MRNNLCIIGVPERGESKTQKKYLKRISENPLNFMKDISLQIKETQRTPNGGKKKPHRDIHAMTHP